MATATLAPSTSRIVPWARMGDEALASRAAAGNVAAFTTLFERYHGPLLGYTRSILRDAEDARDATQAALENAFRALPGRDSALPLRPWLYKIAHNEAISIIRRRRPHAELAPELAPLVDGPEVDAEQRNRLAQLVDDLQSLPERQRGALVMRELNGLSYEEIATALGLTSEAARRAVFDARSALHAAADGRATECVSVRRSISDGDRRSLRARSIRAHLRSCNDCASFQRSIGARRADLHLLAPWMSGAAVVGAIGLGAGAAGGGTVLATSAGTSAAGSGLWAGLPLAAKGLAVAAAVATTGTAAVEIKHASEPRSAATAAQGVRSSAAARASADARRAAALAASRARTAATTRPARVRESAAATTSSAGTAATTKRHRDTPALLPPAPAPAPAPAAATPPPAQVAATPSAAPKTPAETAAAKLGRLGDQVKQALADAQAIAADGSREALALASGLLDRVLGPLRASIDRVLGSVGLSLPAASAQPAQAPQPSTTNVLAPAQQVLGGVQSLLQQLLGRR